MSRRTPEEELKSIRGLVAELSRSEARCPGCAKRQRLAAEQALREHLEPGEIQIVGICLNHEDARHRLASKSNGWK